MKRTVIIYCGSLNCNGIMNIHLSRRVFDYDADHITGALYKPYYW